MTATTENLIERLHDADARRLVLHAGRPPLLVAPDETKPLGEDRLTPRAVTRIVEELRSCAEGEVAGSNGNLRFLASPPAGRVRVQAELGDDSARALIHPEEQEQEGRRREGDGASPREAETADEDGTSPETRVESRDFDGPEGRLRALLRKLVERGGSDLHVSAGERPFIRVDGEMGVLDGEPEISPAETREMVLSIAPERNRKEFEDTRDTDFAYEIEGVARFRCNAFMDRTGVGGVFRQIPSEIWTAEKLGLSDSVLELCELPKGLVVVTGPTGSGKSTTLAAMIDYINRQRSDHIITIEDPIEFTHENKGCLVNQREVGVHTEGFKVALRAALREDPDIVLIGEMRDLETVEIALETAETGHLVFGTLHTNTAPSTVSRVIEQFPGEQQNQIRAMLSESLKGVIAQTLCKRKDGGRIAAMEILLINSAASNLIREGKSFQLPSVMQTGGQDGMKTLNDSLVELVEDGIVTKEEARRNAIDTKDFDRALERSGRMGPGGMQPGGSASDRSL